MQTGSDGIMMKTTKLGTTGVEVSTLCLGTMNFGSRNEWDISCQLLDAYVDGGGSFLDTANVYSRWVEGCEGGESEALLGKWMRERRNRSELFIATKVGGEYQAVTRGLKADQIESECDRSLMRMGIDQIDLFYAHTDDRQTPVEETMTAFDKLVQAGKVRFTGGSNYRAWRLQEALGVCEMKRISSYACIQQRFSYLRPRTAADFGDFQVATNEDLLDICRSKAITLLAYSPLLKACYSREDRPIPDQYTGPDSEARLGVLNAVAGECEASANQIVLAWMMQSSPVVIPINAASTMDQLKENLGAIDVKLSSEQMDRLNQAGDV
jgi:aryl-alcohol dehydrogenase-like predicted oxidoreductase